MDAVRPVGRGLLLTAPDAHVSRETGETDGGLRRVRVGEAGTPPRVGRLDRRGPRGRRLLEQTCDGFVDLGRLFRCQLDVHVEEDRPASPSFGGFGFPKCVSPQWVMPRRPRVRRIPAKRHPPRRESHMLQWNSKFTALLVFGALVAVAATNGLGVWQSLNFTW